MTSNLIPVLAGTASPGTCKYCHRRIQWATTAPHGKVLPFDPDVFVATTTKAENGVQWEFWPREKLHFISCPEAKKRKDAKRPRQTNPNEAAPRRRPKPAAVKAPGPMAWLWR